MVMAVSRYVPFGPRHRVLALVPPHVSHAPALIVPRCGAMILEACGAPSRLAEADTGVRKLQTHQVRAQLLRE
jgi:hypothetical protein